MRLIFLSPLVLFALLLYLAGSGQVTALSSSQAGPQLIHWRARDGAFSSWELHGAEVAADGTVHLSAGAAETKGIFHGDILSPEMAAQPFEEAIASWNVQTPPGTWIDVEMRVWIGEEATDWFQMATWTSASSGSIRRQSIEGQGDDRVAINVDTLVLKEGAGRADKVQLRLRLLSNVAGASPSVQGAAVSVSDHRLANPPLSTGNPALWNRALPVPPCSQMVYPDGGEVWCSPTATSMVIGYWRQQAGDANAAGSCEERVRHAVDGVYDYVYEGHGNWPFNVAYAATQGLEGYVTRLRGLDQAEEWIARGVPVVVSFGWGEGDLDGAPLPQSNGHLAVLSGFDASGNPIVHDPAAPSDASVPRAYPRAQFERLWLAHSGGTAYIIAPPAFFDPPLPLYLPLITR